MKAKLIACALASGAALAFVPSCANDPATRTNASNASAAQISHDSRAALRSLYAQNPTARAMGRKAKGVLVFPSVVKGGFIFGAQGGNGAMILNSGEISGYYETFSASYGFQAGLEEHGYALFFMNNKAFRNLDRSEGWEIGTSPNLVIVNHGVATALTTTTVDPNTTYAYFFNHRGLMGGLSLEGTKITRIHPKH
jgi:lipid-binding SYLF domain-containing protein